MGGSHYFVIFVNDFSRYTWIYLICKISELLAIYIQFTIIIKTQFFSTIKIFHINNAMEYRDYILTQFHSQNGIIIHRCCLGTSQ